MRWRQKFNKTTQKSEFIPIDEGAIRAARAAEGASIHGIFEPFKSVVDGSIINTAGQLREHNVRNNVVCADEFSSEFYEKKAKERANFYEGKHNTAETLSRKQEIYETMIAAERKNGYY